MRPSFVIAPVLICLGTVLALAQEPPKLSPYNTGKDTRSVMFTAASKSLIVIRQSDGIVRDGDGNDLADMPLTEQVAKLCAALEGVSRTKFTKCGGTP